MTNVVSVQLARYQQRLRELAIRAALGAGTARVVRQSMLEMLLLAALGSIAGLVLVAALHRLVPTLLPCRLSAHGRPAPRLRRGGVRRGRHGPGGHRLWADTGAHPPARSRQLARRYGSTPLGAGDSSRTVRVRLLLMGGQVAAASLLLGAALLGRSFVGMLQAIAASIRVACSRHGCRCPRAVHPGTPAPVLEEGAGTPRPNAGNRAGGIHRNAARTRRLDERVHVSTTRRRHDDPGPGITPRRATATSTRSGCESWPDAASRDRTPQANTCRCIQSPSREHCGGNASARVSRWRSVHGYNGTRRLSASSTMCDIRAGHATMPERSTRRPAASRLVVPMVTLMVRAWVTRPLSPRSFEPPCETETCKGTSTG